MQTYNLYDSDFRKKLIANPKLMLQEINKEIEVNVVKNTRNTTYIVMPNNFSQADLENIQAAACASTIGTAGSASTLGSVCTTLGSTTTIGSVGSVGSK